MITFFRKGDYSVIAVESDHRFNADECRKLQWLFSESHPLDTESVSGTFVGPRREMITPWSTNAVEITQNMGLSGISRIEEFFVSKSEQPTYDKMLQRVYHGLDSKVFDVDKQPAPIVYIDDLEKYNEQEGLALSTDEIGYLRGLAERLGRPLTDSEVFGFSQVNSEHCRH